MVDGVPWFRGDDATTILGYTNTRTTVLYHVKPYDNKKLEELRENESFSLSTFALNELNTIYINELGIYSLIIRSKKMKRKHSRDGFILLFSVHYKARLL